jgi:zinc protease
MNTNFKYDVAQWGVYAMFNPLYKGRLDSALHQEIDKAITAGFTKDELEKSKNSLMEQNRTSLGDNGFLARQLRWYIRDERSLDDFTNFENKVKALTLEEVNAALRKYFDKSKLVLVYGGDFDKIKTPEKTEKKGF